MLKGNRKNIKKRNSFRLGGWGMQAILKNIGSLANNYISLTDSLEETFQALKVSDIEKLEVLERNTELLYKEKEHNEIALIGLVKERATKLGLEEQRIETILETVKDIEEKTKVEYELNNMLKQIDKFQTALKRNVEFASIIAEIKNKEMEIMIEFAEREQQARPMLLNKEL